MPTTVATRRCSTRPAPSAGLPDAVIAVDVGYWYVGPNQASPQIEVDNDKALWDAWKQTYPNIPMVTGESVQNLDYNQMLDKIRTAAAGNAAPDLARMPILWGVEFAAKGQLAEIKPEDFGFKADDFWTGAMKSVERVDSRMFSSAAALRSV